MRVKSVVKWFHARRFRTKILLAFLVVTVLPVLTLGSYIVTQKSASILEQEEREMETKLQVCLASIERSASKIENSLDTIALDPNVSDMLNSEYISDYDKYYKVTKHFDAVIGTILSTNEAISDITFYVSNSLQNVRKSMRSLEELADDSFFYQGIDGGRACEWFFDGSRIQIYRRVYYLQDTTKFSVAKATVNVSDIINSEIFADVNCNILIKNESIFRSFAKDYESGDVYKTADLIKGSGSLVLYRDKYFLLDSISSVIMMVILLLAVFVMLIVVIYLISGSLVKRLNYVNTSLSSIVENNFETELIEDYDDEIGNLAHVANKMIADTKRLIEDVYQGELKQKEAEFKALQAQINPHFLYNALSAVNWRAITSDNMEISYLVTMLSKFYRTALNKGKRVTTVQNEIENIKAYVDIQLCVHGNSFDVVYDIDESALEFCMPNLIIQPIVENAIEHGIDCLESGRGYLEINVKMNNGQIGIAVMNNGSPIENTNDILAHEGSGYGLYNVNKRLELFFGDKYSIGFKSGNLTTAYIAFYPVENTEQ